MRVDNHSLETQGAADQGPARERRPLRRQRGVLAETYAHPPAVAAALWRTVRSLSTANLLCGPCSYCGGHGSLHSCHHVLHQARHAFLTVTLLFRRE